MAKKYKEYFPLSVRMEKDIFENLEDFCNEYGMSKTAVIERSVLQYIGDFREKAKKKRTEEYKVGNFKAMIKNVEDFRAFFPELAEQMHPSKNGDLEFDDIIADPTKKIWWLLPYDDPFNGKHFEFEWKASVIDRVDDGSCPFLTGRKVWRGYNDLASKYPELARQWHSNRNGELRPEDVMYNSCRKVWWYLPFNDYRSGRHYDFEWEASIINRVNGQGCPFLTGKVLDDDVDDCPGESNEYKYMCPDVEDSLESKYPYLAKEWDYNKNGGLKPSEIKPDSKRKVWWRLPYDDPISGKHFDFEWQTTVQSRVRGSGCPYLSGRAIWPGFNDLATTYPGLAKEWHPNKNGKLQPSSITADSLIKVWWVNPYNDSKTGVHSQREWIASVADRVREYDKCQNFEDKDANTENDGSKDNNLHQENND